MSIEPSQNEQSGHSQHTNRHKKAGYFWYKTKSQPSNVVIFLRNEPIDTVLHNYFQHLNRYLFTSSYSTK